MTAVHRCRLHGRGGVWGYGLPHLNASTTIRVSLLIVKQYEIRAPHWGFGKLNFSVSFTVGHGGQQ